MAEILLRVLYKAGRTINNPFSMGGSYVEPRRGDAQKDIVKIVGDMRQVGQDLRKKSDQTFKQYGK
jgi:hypothetical protein